MLVFELGCSTTKNECPNAWSTIGIASAVRDLDNSLLLVICRDIIRNMIDHHAKVELHLCACQGNSPDDEPACYSNGDAP